MVLKMMDKTKKELIWENLQLRWELTEYKVKTILSGAESFEKRLDNIDSTLKVMKLLQDPEFIKELERLVDRNKPLEVAEDD